MITVQPPNTVHLGGPIVTVNVLPASQALTPGWLIERFVSGSATELRPHSTQGGKAQKLVALNQPQLNHSVDFQYAANDQVEAGLFPTGSTAWMFIASGVSVNAGDFMSSNGDGTLRKVTGSDVALFTALETINNSAGPGAVRIRSEAL